MLNLDASKFGYGSGIYSYTQMTLTIVVMLPFLSIKYRNNLGKTLEKL